MNDFYWKQSFTYKILILKKRMEQLLKIRFPDAESSSKAKRKLTKKRSLSWHSISNISILFDIKVTQKKVEKINWLHFFLDDTKDDEEYFCDECKHLILQGKYKSIDDGSISSWRSENKNKSRRFSRPLKKLKAMDE